MLVLGRKPGEYIMIGNDVMVKVIKSDEGDLRLAINAPKDIIIVRGEVLEKQGQVRSSHYKERVHTNQKTIAFADKCDCTNLF